MIAKPGNNFIYSYRYAWRNQSRVAGLAHLWILHLLKAKINGPSPWDRNLHPLLAPRRLLLCAGGVSPCLE